MAAIAIAGSTGEVAREVIDALAAAEKHRIVLLTRKEVDSLPVIQGTEWMQVDYSDKENLTQVLKGVDVVLSFVTPQTDSGNVAQKNLIDASIQAGVKRFAPSEWATSSFEHMEWYAGKAEIRDYLKEVNTESKILEYSLFQPGLFTNYLTHPYKSAGHMSTFETQIDFQNRRAIIPDVGDDVKISLTTVQDLAAVVVKAIEFEGEWPVVGGVKGCEMSFSDLIYLGEEIRGGSFVVEKLKIDDLKGGVVKTMWLPIVDHPAIPAEQANAFAKNFLAGFTLGISAGALNVSDEWNRLLPDHQFEQPREFLLEAWKCKP